MSANKTSYPVNIRAELSKPPSRALWLVKWLLLVPHFIVLAFLWAAYVVVAFIAFWAILFTARFPKKLFTFNVGVLRWTWRVGFYWPWILGTDVYPPFSLKPSEEFPADLEIDYPERLSRGLPFVKWLLAVPHYMVLSPLMGWGMWQASEGRNAPFIGLIFALAIIIAVVLLFTKKYNEDIFRINTGIVRWYLRVMAYIGLMTDKYPPFVLWE
jgi:hypothetical protein